MDWAPDQPGKGGGDGGCGFQEAWEAAVESAKASGYEEGLAIHIGDACVREVVQCVEDSGKEELACEKGGSCHFEELEPRMDKAAETLVKESNRLGFPTQKDEEGKLSRGAKPEDARGDKPSLLEATKSACVAAAMACSCYDPCKRQERAACAHAASLGAPVDPEPEGEVLFEKYAGSFIAIVGEGGEKAGIATGKDSSEPEARQQAYEGVYTRLAGKEGVPGLMSPAEYALLEQMREAPHKKIGNRFVPVSEADTRQADTVFRRYGDSFYITGKDGPLGDSAYAASYQRLAAEEKSRVLDPSEHGRLRKAQEARFARAKDGFYRVNADGSPLEGKAYEDQYQARALATDMSGEIPPEDYRKLRPALRSEWERKVLPDKAETSG